MRSHTEADPKTILALLLLRVRVELQWISSAAFDVARAGAISPEDAEEISDHADAAEETLLGPLMHFVPDLPELEEAGQVSTRVPRRARPRGKNAKRSLMSAIEDALVVLHADIQGAISDLYREAPPEAKTELERASNDAEDASDSLEAALLALEPDYFRKELSLEPDPDERIAKASHLEYIEARRAEVRQTNDFSRLVSDASMKIRALGEGNAPTAGLVRQLLGALSETNAESTINQLMEAAFLTEDEARAFVGLRLVPRRLS